MIVAGPLPRRVGGRATVADWSERAAIACSAACLALLLAAMLLPPFTAVPTIPESSHLSVLGAAILGAASGLGLGWRRHRLLAPLIAGAVGLVLLAIGTLVVGGTVLQVPVTITDCLTVATALLVNGHYRHSPDGGDERR